MSSHIMQILLHSGVYRRSTKKDVRQVHLQGSHAGHLRFPPENVERCKLKYIQKIIHFGILLDVIITKINR